MLREVNGARVWRHNSVFGRDAVAVREHRTMFDFNHRIRRERTGRFGTIIMNAQRSVRLHANDQTVGAEEKVHGRTTMSSDA